MMKCLLIPIAICLFQNSNAQIWSNQINGQNPSASNPFVTGQNVAANITVSGIGRGSGLTAFSYAGGYAAGAWASPPDENDYFYFTLIPNSGYTITISGVTLEVLRNNSGPTQCIIYSSEDNYSTPLYQGSVTVNGNTFSASINKTYSSAITFRMYGLGSTSSSNSVFSINSFVFGGSVNTIPLPLTLLSFDAEAKNGNAFLNWRCVNQKNISHFEIERSNDGNIFKPAGIVNAQNVAEEMDYNFNEPLPKQKNAFYRLKIYETNGTPTYSKVVSLKISGDNNITTYPNPFTDKLVLKGLVENSNIQVSDIYGRIIFQKENAGDNTEIDTRSWANGIYMVRVNNNYLTRMVKK